MSASRFWALLNDDAGLQISAARKHALLSMYVVATGRDGYRSVVSLAEVSPAFGAKPVIVGVREGAVTDTELRLIVPGDRKPGRSVSRLTDLTVVEVARPTK